MFKIIVFSSLSMFLMLACKGEVKQTDTDQIKANVRNYFFLDDSVKVNIEITDTMYREELQELMTTVNQNLNLIDRDLDTLSLMIDDQSYKKLAYEKEMEAANLLRKRKYEDSLNQTEKIVLEYLFKQVSLNSKKESFKQTNRVLLNLQRSIWANVAGFNIKVNYELNEPFEFDLMLDANLRIVD